MTSDNSCKIVVERFTNPPSYTGDCLAVYDADFYLGPIVESQGGFNVLIFVTDANKENEIIKKLVEDEAENPSYNKKQFLQPVNPGDNFFAELLSTGRVYVTLEELKQYIKVR